MLCAWPMLRSAGDSAAYGRLRFWSVTPTTGGAWFGSPFSIICRPRDPT